MLKDYGMFTPAGDAAVSAIVCLAIENYRGFDYVNEQLRKLAEVDLFSEATDTVVREACYLELETKDAL
jgi:hypothetical protein